MGKIKAKNIKARHIVAGIKIDGEVSDEGLKMKTIATAVILYQAVQILF